MFKTIDKEISAEITEKKSKFIANIFYVETVEQAERKIKEIKKKYFDARHNCFAFSIYTENGIVNRFSDDGEPSGTAGAPMLNILTGKEISNVLVIVTRYFGGILLGTGGLVRAYTGAVQEALKNAQIIKKDLGLEAKIEVSYSDFEKAKYFLKQNEIKIINFEYLENVNIIVEITEEKFRKIVLLKDELDISIIKMEKLSSKFIEIN